MSGVSITGLNPASTLTGSEIVPIVQSGTTVRTTVANLGPTGSFTQSGTGAVATTIQSKLRETVSVFDFMTAAQVADVQSHTGSIDVTAAFNAAALAATSAKKALYVPAGKYRIDSPISTEASPLGGFHMIGESEVHHGYVSANTQINLSNNTQYFAAVGYGAKIQGISFFNAAADVIHHTSTYPGGGQDGNFCQLQDVSCIEFAGTFFKGFGTGNGSHISWTRIFLVSLTNASVIWDDTAVGFDNLTADDCWFETSGTIGFKFAAGRLGIYNTRFIPYTNVPSNWFEFTNTAAAYFANTDFGGESYRKVLDWKTAGGNITFESVGFFSNAGADTLYLTAPPNLIQFSGCDTNTSSSPNLITINPAMTAANKVLLSYMTVNRIGNTKAFDLQLQSGVNPNNNIVAMLASQYTEPQRDAVVSPSDLLAMSGYAWQTGGSSTNVTQANGASAPDIYGGANYGYKFTATADGAFGYVYYSGGPGVSTIPDGEATYELLCSVANGSVSVNLVFGSPDVTGLAKKTFYLGPGNHALTFPLLLTSSTHRLLGFEYVIPNNGTTITINRIKVFKGLYNARRFEMYATAAPTGTSLNWEVGDIVMRSTPTAGQPKGWVCTVAGAPGTWVSLGNL